MSARIFISQSAKTDEAEAYLGALTSALEAEGRFEKPERPYWLDRADLKAGAF